MTPPSILFAHDFDPAGVMIQWREALRRAGGKAWVAGTRAYIHRADFDPICRKPDVIVVCPGVGDGSGGDPGPTAVRTLPSWVEELLAKWPKIPRVALFHGSLHCWPLREEYARYWHRRGFALASTTLDYVTEMGKIAPCAWLPPLVERAGADEGRMAVLHLPGRPLVVLQTPSDPAACGTQDFLNAVRLADAIPLASWRIPHAMNLDLKLRFSVGFDHFRGAPSVNALENAACGQASIFSLFKENRATMESLGVPAPSTAIEPTRDALEEKVRYMVERPEIVEDWQDGCLAWWWRYFDEAAILGRLDAFFGGLL
ncbi:MAG: hypothetical protein EPO08_21080 [Rhodospirillaceae bacterium]|nr:MAG: hypothetical protein EPO08_21080 [Rhodospirillaceae bacterium]